MKKQIEKRKAARPPDGPPPKKTAKWKKRAIIAAVPLLVLLLLFYGPFEGFRLLWINTAMNTSRFKFLAQMLYTESYIDRVMAEHAVNTDQKTDIGMIEVNGGEDMSFTEIKGDTYRGYLIKIDDPSRLFLVQAGNEQGKLLEELVAGARALGGINAGGFLDDRKRGLEWGYHIQNSEILNRCSDCKTHELGGLDEQGRFIVGSFSPGEIAGRQFRWAIEFRPILIVNGEKSKATPFSGGIAPRTAIGQTRKGEMLLVVVDGRQPASIGATFADLQEILHANGAINAIALDGGSSSSMVYEGRLVNSPSDGDSQRGLPNAIVFR